MTNSVNQSFILDLFRFLEVSYVTTMKLCSHNI